MTVPKDPEKGFPGNEQLFSTLFYSSPAMLAISRISDQHLLMVNRVFLDTLGLSESEIAGKSSRELGLFVNPQARDRAFEKMQPSGSLKGFEMQLRKRDGGILTVLSSSELIKIGGEPCLLTSAIDISDHKAAEQALRESETKYRLLVENINAGIFQTALTGKFIQVNAAVVKMAGYDSIGDLMSRPASCLYADPSDREMLTSILTRQDEVRELELLSVKKDGTRYWISLNAVLVRDTDGSPNGLLGIIRDISEKKQAEKDLRASEERYRNLVEQSIAGIGISHGNEIIFANRKLLEIFGYPTVEEIQKIPLIDLVAPSSRAMLSERVRLVQEGKPVAPEFEYDIVRKSGEIRTLRAYSSHFPFQDGEIYSQTVFQDITEHKRTEEALQNAQKLEALGALAGGIAHDYNNLMSGIFGYIDLAAESTRDASVRGYLEKASTAIDRARGLTRQLLTFAKGGGPVRNVDRLFPFVSETVQFALSGSNVSFRIDAAEDLWPSCYDRNQTGQVIDNIVINAQQAMPLGGTILVSAINREFGEKGHPLLKPGRYVRLSFQDTGTGISADLLPRIFDPFFTTKERGHGLGLATSYSIVRRHEGCIDVESVLGKGSTFHVYLPAVTGPVPDAISASRPRFTGTGTVIVMDDEEMIRDTLGYMLRSLGFNPVGARNGTEVLEDLNARRLRKEKIAFMILDLTIPGGMGGIETAAEIRKINPGLPIFVASGYADDPVLKKPGEYGFDASLRKPFTLDELARMLDRFLTFGGAASGSPRPD